MRATVILCGGHPVDHGVCACGSRAIGRCSFALRGRLAGSTCDKPLCARCAVPVGEAALCCAPHARMSGVEGVVG